MRCRKARWYLSARCDGTLSERQRLRLEEHLASCEGCRREGFYFAEIGSTAMKLEPHPVRPDFNLRLRAAIRRADEQALRPIRWQDRVGAVVFRPALVAAGVMVLGLGGLGAWSMMKGQSAQKPTVAETVGPEVNPEYGLRVGYGEDGGTAPDGGLVPVDGLSPEDRRIQERYLQTEQMARTYIMEGESLDRSSIDSASPRFVLPTVSPDQVNKKVSY